MKQQALDKIRQGAKLSPIEQLHLDIEVNFSSLWFSVAHDENLLEYVDRIEDGFKELTLEYQNRIDALEERLAEAKSQLNPESPDQERALAYEHEKEIEGRKTA